MVTGVQTCALPICGEGADVELGVVGQYGADAGEDGAAFGAQDLYVVSGGFASNPLAEAV